MVQLDSRLGERMGKPNGIVVGQALGVVTRSGRVALPNARPAAPAISKPRAPEGLTPAPPLVPALMLPPTRTARVVRRAALPRRQLSSHTERQICSPTETPCTEIANATATATAPSALIGGTTRAAVMRGDNAREGAMTASNPSIARPKPQEVATAKEDPSPPRAPPTIETKTVIKKERKRAIEDEEPTGATGPMPHYKRHVTEDALRAYDMLNTAKFLELAATISQTTVHTRDPHRQHLIKDAFPSAANVRWTVYRKQEAFRRIREFFWTRLDVGLDIQRTLLRKYLEADRTRQGLFVLGSSPQSTSLVISSLLRRLDHEMPSDYDYYHVKGHLYCTPHDLYDAIRHQMRGKCGQWKLPPWRNVATSLTDTRSIPLTFTSSISVLVIESIDALVKAMHRTQAPLDRLFRFLNRLVQVRGLKLIVIGHTTQTLERFTSYFGGFIAANEDEYMLRLPQYTIPTIVEHLQAVATAALAPMGDAVRLHDVFAKQVIELAARKAAKAGQCELDPVLSLLRSAMVRMLCECRHDKGELELDESKWKLRYEHVIEVSTKLFQHDLVHRIQCVGAMTQAVLLVLIDAGPCTEEELFHHVYERHKVHVWILIITYFRREKFDVALELLLSVPVVKTREIRVSRGDSWHTELQYYALPSRQQFIEAAGKKPLIKLIL